MTITETHEEREARASAFMTGLGELGWHTRPGYGEDALFSPTGRISIAVTDAEGSFDILLWRERRSSMTFAGQWTELTGQLSVSNLTDAQLRAVLVSLG